MVQPISLQIRNPKGKIDALALAEKLDLSVSQMAAALGVSPQGLRKNPASPNIQERANQLELVLSKLFQLVGNEAHALAWLNAIDPSLGYPPMRLILEGDFSTLDDILEGIMQGIPA
jgi:hypothetical protein